MRIIHTKSFDSSLKRLKKHQLEYNNLNKIINIIENSDDFNQLIKLPQVVMYGFERLKHDKNDYYSFNPRKKGETIRLIVKPKEDFNPKKVIYYE